MTAYPVLAASLVDVSSTIISSVMLCVGACTALGEMGRAGALPLPAEKKKQLVNKLLSIVKADKNNVKVSKEKEHLLFM